jgi:hypothetical protein
MLDCPYSIVNLLLLLGIYYDFKTNRTKEIKYHISI